LFSFGLPVFHLLLFKVGFLDLSGVLDTLHVISN